jgi:Acyl-coenzyme A:6-aminopenicillanic acid acyl-transferase
MRARALFAVAVFAVISTNLAPAADPVIREDKVVAGGPKDALEVRHLILKGTNEEIGRALAEITRERFQAEPDRSTDRLRTRAQRKYMEKNYPILFDRMRGAAAAFGKKVDDDTWTFGGLTALPSRPGRPGCSVVYLPPGVTASGTGVVSRNYDFSTGTMFGTVPPPGQPGDTSRPYLIEMYPDCGYASLAMSAYDLLSGALDGVNSEGLTVALLADDELMEKFKLEPTLEPQAGLGVLQVVRMLLDTCATADEAKQALLMTKQYYEFIPCHYLIADRHGKAFVWEYSHAHNKEFIVEDPGKPLVTTNFSLHRHLKAGKPPSAEEAKAICPRYCALAECLVAAKEKVTLEALKDAHKRADFVFPAPRPGRATTRTLWHALYEPDKRAVQISYYLRDEPGPADGKKAKVARTEYLEFALKGVK